MDIFNIKLSKEEKDILNKKGGLLSPPFVYLYSFKMSFS